MQDVVLGQTRMPQDSWPRLTDPVIQPFSAQGHQAEHGLNRFHGPEDAETKGRPPTQETICLAFHFGRLVMYCVCRRMHLEFLVMVECWLRVCMLLRSRHAMVLVNIHGDKTKCMVV